MYIASSVTIIANCATTDIMFLRGRYVQNFMCRFHFPGLGGFKLQHPSAVNFLCNVGIKLSMTTDQLCRPECVVL